MTTISYLEMLSPSGEELKVTRLKAGLSQVDAAELMGYPVQAGSRGGLQSRTWQALESASDARTMPAPVFVLFQLLTDQHPELALMKKYPTSEIDVHKELKHQIHAK